MITVIQKWGNSLGVRIPKSVAQDVQVEAGTSVTVEVSDGRLVISPVRGNTFDLAELVAQITLENQHGVSEFGPRVGREAW